MAKTSLILIILAGALSRPAALTAKDRAWQAGQLLDKAHNPYFRTVAAEGKEEPAVSGSSGSSFTSSDNGALAIASRASDGNVSYENYVIAGADTVYLVEFAHFKTFPAANLSIAKPFSFAVEKNKLIILDLDHREFETSIVKQTSKQGTAVATAGAATVAPPAVQKAEVKKETPKADKPKQQPAKPDNLFATAALSKQDAAPPQAPKPQQTTPAAKAPAQPVAVASTVKPTPKPDPVPPVKPAVAKPEGPVARATTKDRAWQSGHLLSVANNNYFFNVTYTSDAEGSSWPFSQGSDGRFTVTGQIAGNTDSAYTYDNYVLESEFVAYLVQRMRPKTSPAARLPGTKPLKFAVEKNKLWVLDDNGIEYETKVIKLIQKDSIVDPTARAAAR